MCLLVVLNTSADMIVDLGSARDFMVLDVNPSPVTDALLSKGIFNGDIGWSGGSGTKVKVRRGSVTGDLYRDADSKLKLRKGGELLGSDFASSDMSGFIAGVDAAVANFGQLQQDIDLGSINSGAA